MKIVLMQVGATRNASLATLIDDYSRRIGHYMPFDTITIPDVKGRGLTPERQKTLEGQAMLARLAPGDRVVLLDERGQQPTSRQWAADIQAQAVTGLKRLIYVIGGPWGFSGEMYTRADGQLSLSRLTLPHELARLIVVEQLYRAMTILRGEPYHHD